MLEEIRLQHHKIKFGDIFLVIEPAQGYDSVEYVKEFDLVGKEAKNGRFILENNQTKDRRYVELNLLIELKQAQPYLRRVLINYKEFRS
jgi:hypothetical protein